MFPIPWRVEGETLEKGMENRLPEGTTKRNEDIIKKK